MKKVICLAVLFILVLTTGCQTAIERDKAKMLEIFQNTDNYITLTGTVIQVDNGSHRTKIVVRCEELKQLLAQEDDECEYWVFSNSNVNISVGDSIVYTTVPLQDPYGTWLPIVAISTNGNDILNFEEGRENLIEWVNQLQMK